MPRYNKQDTFEEATACVSDLESVQRELEELMKVAHIKAITRMQSAVNHIEEAVATLMWIENH